MAEFIYQGQAHPEACSTTEVDETYFSENHRQYFPFRASVVLQDQGQGHPEAYSTIPRLIVLQ